MKMAFVELPIPTRDGQFIAPYSAKGLAELNFPVGRPSSAVAPLRRVEAYSRAVSRRRRGNESQSFKTEIVRDSFRLRLATARQARRLLQVKITLWHRATAAALGNVLAGRSPGKLPPLDLADGTEFQQKVWNALRKIAWGRTKSYGEVARAIGQPKAVRAVGGACGANPIPVLVPCHRVLAATEKSAALAADWIGNKNCWRGKGSNFDSPRR